jgi:trehalose/maltose hydrolase-like predicted phosphorylase
MLHFCILISGSVFIFLNFFLHQIITDFEKVQDDSRLAVNLAGHGSLLQGILNGYGGLELLSDRLVIDPVIPEGTQSWTIDALDYQGYVLNLKFTETKTHIKIVTHGKNSLLFVEDVNGVTRTPVSREIFVKRAKVFVIVTPKPEYHWSEVPYLFESHV